jgi:hypothetical protein
MQSVAVVASPQVGGCVSQDDFSSCVANLAMLLALSEKPLPQVLVLHVTEDIAACFGVDHRGVIRHNRCERSGLPTYYEVWLVGQSDPSDYIMSSLGVLEDYFQLTISPQERQRLLESVAWTLASDRPSTYETVQ